jgi:hypothetical protein
MKGQEIKLLWYYLTGYRYGKLHSWSALLIFFEGVGGSIIIALVAMMYSDRYEDGEAKI